MIVSAVSFTSTSWLRNEVFAPYRVGIADFNPHDPRRTAGTTMAELGVPRFIVERVLNHTDRTVTSVYDRYSYGAEKRSSPI